LSAPGSTRFLSLGTKLVAFIAALLSLVGLVLYLELAQREWQNLVQAKRTAAAMVGDLLAASLVAPLDFGDAAGIEKNLGNLEQNGGDVEYAVVRGEGSVEPVAELHHGHAGPAALEAGAPGDRAAMAGDRVVARREITDPTGKRLGSAVVEFSLAPERAAYDGAKRRILWLSLLLTAAVAAALIGVTRRMIVMPLERLAGAAREVENGRAARVDVRANDELGRLGGAFNAMAAAIADRERRLGELFDHMRQAILVFGPDGKVERTASRRAVDLFGTTSLQGLGIAEALYPGAPGHSVEVRALDEWRELVFASPASAFDELAELGPAELTLERGGERIVLTLEFRPIDRGDEVTRVMLLATDVTEARTLEHAVVVTRLEHARQMASMRLLIAGGAHQFAGFAEDATARLKRGAVLLAAEPFPATALDEVFQIVHTLRGEARTFDLQHFEAEALQAEGLLGRLRAGASTAAQRQELGARLDGALAAIRAATEEFVARSPIGRTVLDQVTVRRSDVARIEELAAGRDDALAQAAIQLTARPFGELAFRQASAVPPLAEKVSKQVRVDIEGNEVLVPAAVARVLGGALAALCRNAVAHGIERPAEREERGKARTGRIVLACVAGGRSPRITVEDDGAGLDARALRERARSLGVAEPADGAGELVFVPGLSTAASASELAGRGVGLAAVASDLAAVDWKISVWTEASRGTRFTLEQR